MSRWMMSAPHDDHMKGFYNMSRPPFAHVVVDHEGLSWIWGISQGYKTTLCYTHQGVSVELGAPQSFRQAEYSKVLGILLKKMDKNLPQGGCRML